MGKRGPRPTPTAILEARGSRKAEGRKNEPQTSGLPECPEWVTDDARAIWGRAIDHLQELGVIGRADENALIRYCVTFARWMECERFIQDNGMTNGSDEYPQVTRASRLSEQLLKLEREFGLTPAARVNLTPTNPAANKGSDGIGSLLKLAQ